MPVLHDLKHCPQCGTPVASSDAVCPICRFLLAAPTTQLPSTGPLDREPVIPPGATPAYQPFLDRSTLVLQLLPSGACLSFPSTRMPLVLGRGGGAIEATMVDLSEHYALQHGVSRRHVRLERVGNQLTVTDLGSLNGTYLNDDALEPDRAYELHHGDRLVLGTLHILVTFHHGI